MSTYAKFLDFLEKQCTYEVLYKDSGGRDILVIDLLDAYRMIYKWQEYIAEKTGSEKKQWRIPAAFMLVNGAGEPLAFSQQPIESSAFLGEKLVPLFDLDGKNT